MLRKDLRHNWSEVQRCVTVSGLTAIIDSTFVQCIDEMKTREYSAATD